MSSYQNKGWHPGFWEDQAYARQIEQHGPTRAKLIRAGQDPRTITDLNKWNSLGRRQEAS